MNTNAKAPLALGAPFMGVRSFYARVSALGFGLIALAGIVNLVLAIANGNTGGGAGFVLVFILIGLVVAGLVWRFGRWALIPAVILSFAMLALVVPFTLFELSHPESAQDFIPVVLTVVGTLLSFVGSVVAIVQWRRGTARASGTSTERLALGVTLGVLAGLILLSMILTLTGRATVSAEAKTGAINVVMKNTSFTPATLQVKAGETVRLLVRNDDQTLHTFTLPQAGVDVSVPPGSEKIVEFKAPASGMYQWYCIPHSDQSSATRVGMVGALQVP